MSKQGRGQSKMHGVNYKFVGEFDESAADKILEPAVKAGIVTQYDTGRGSCLWFEGKPGKELRALKARIVEELRVKQVSDEDWGKY